MDFYSTDINQNVAPLPGEGTVARTASKAHYSLWYNNALKLTNILLKSLRCKLQTNRYEEDRGFDVYYVIIKSIALLMTAKESLILSQIPPSLPPRFPFRSPQLSFTYLSTRLSGSQKKATHSHHINHQTHRIHSNSNNSNSNNRISSKTDSSKQHTQHFSFANTGASNRDKLLSIVRKIDKSNLKCCDCGSTATVEWVSINLLCILCIKCSGVHRSLGSHISKIRSLTLDNFTSLELMHLLQNNVSNSNVNAIYESNLHNFSIKKITSISADSERSKFIIDKYQHKKFVIDGNQGREASLKSLIKAIHLDSVFMMQRAIAQSKYSLRELTASEKEQDDLNHPSIFQYSLKHYEIVDGTPVFFITEFLLCNGIHIDNLPKITKNWSPKVLEYWETKLEMYGTFQDVNASRPKSGPHLNIHSNVDSASSYSKKHDLRVNIPERSASASKRWSLSSIPKSSQNLMSPTNLLAMHKSLKLTKKDKK
ncbi:Age1p [Saccharomyces cerevisiae YJM1078]|nr:Age1p [Saccharomyces cerevisiae YJM1078]AJU61069.1 Age1p [Saccharomyces cerevisiae YJM248]